MCNLGLVLGGNDWRGPVARYLVKTPTTPDGMPDDQAVPTAFEKAGCGSYDHPPGATRNHRPDCYLSDRVGKIVRSYWRNLCLNCRFVCVCYLLG